MGFIALITKRWDKDTAKAIGKIDAVITGIFIILDAVLLLAGLKNWLILGYFFTIHIMIT